MLADQWRKHAAIKSIIVPYHRPLPSVYENHLGDTFDLIGPIFPLRRAPNGQILVRYRRRVPRD